MNVFASVSLFALATSSAMQLHLQTSITIFAPSLSPDKLCIECLVLWWKHIWWHSRLVEDTLVYPSSSMFDCCAIYPSDSSLCQVNCCVNPSLPAFWLSPGNPAWHHGIPWFQVVQYISGSYFSRPGHARSCFPKHHYHQCCLVDYYDYTFPTQKVRYWGIEFSISIIFWEEQIKFAKTMALWEPNEQQAV